MLNNYEFIKDMLGRELTLRQINEKYNLGDCVEYYHSIQPQYLDYIKEILEGIYTNNRITVKGYKA